ncbi:beta strand repeat-containing protein [Nostoc sp.]|uniref:beta strand repeat-containing protein n=1 Tax=Nostoc sp. TaxID=1180 RepID=UPI002FFC5284
MVNRKKSVNKQRQPYLSLVATALLTGSFFQFIAPVLADGTAAGTPISNTATATYEDPNAPGSPINSTSNTVTVTVAEVAGITVTGSGIANQTNPGGSTKAGDTLVYTYTVTNVGNDLTKFQIPNLATTTGPATVSGLLPGSSTSGNLQYSTDGGTTWINIPAGGLTTGAIAVNGTVLVRVPVTVQAGAQAGDTITARLGQTPGDAQNQPRIADGGDVYTVDNSNTAGAPINGVREASATQQTQVGNTAKTRALATILKTKTAYDNAGTSTPLTDDLLTYGLSLRVEGNDVTNTGVTPAALAGENISVDGATVSRILVSDAIPANTVLNSTPIAPSGWRVVYTTTTTNTNAEAATWSTTAPASLSSVTRVGFINDPNLVTSVGTGTTVNGFSIQVKTTGATGNGPVNIYNIAQVAGTTAGDPTTKIYDNSGDQNPDNFNSTGQTFPTTPDGGFVANGTVVPANQTDAQNNNTGTNSPTGDYNIATLSVPNATSVLNGPNGVPDAIGPTSNNDDFTNKSALIPPNIAPGLTVNPAAVSFTNTVQNSGTSPANISLVPTPPTTPGDLPSGTVVTVSYQGLSAAYTYNGTIFTFTSGAGTVGGNPISATNPVRIDAVPANGGKANYGVSVDLPAGTPLSTDTTAQGAAVTTTIERGFPTPVTAFIDTNNNGLFEPAVDTANNTSIDRVYTGFLQLLKESRVLQGTGPALPGGSTDGTFSTTAKKPAPGNIIEYRITYKNISTPQVGSGNVILNVDKIVITEDGTQSPNNWAKDNDNNSLIDTSNIVSSAKDSGTSTIQFFPGNDQTGTTANTDVTKYVDAVTGQVAPGIQRTFTFQRKVN